MGEGPASGGNRGRCTSVAGGIAGVSFGNGRGNGRGNGCGIGRGNGRGNGCGIGRGNDAVGPRFSGQSSSQTEENARLKLEQEMDELKQRILDIQARMDGVEVVE
ncbi:MAG: hypothetical protein CVU65_07555 [Deltaproteobacteria bacterium HGW-Deltaproteobacteria-22]|jgi:hypothetical protein|nr:MAG: hypothetical protein CVU65_07555 [Deltaproteobacteria bacterium HGW-Deltaproteobacteria-22]